jgi:hypothetical protein
MKLIIFFLSYASLWHSIHGQEYESTSFRLRGSDEELAAKAGQTAPVRRLIESMYMSAPILEAEISMSATPIIEAARRLIGDWEFCSSSTQCMNGCCSNRYSDDGELKCTPVGGFQADHCVTGPAPTPMVSPVTGCEGGGDACGCGLGGDGGQISMNRFWGNDNDEKVFGCGGAFALDGASWDAQLGGTLSETGGEVSAMQSAGLTFSQSASYDGWEGCCLICGVNLELTGKISTGWYCVKDFFSTGIWLKGVNKQ